MGRAAENRADGRKKVDKGPKILNPQTLRERPPYMPPAHALRLPRRTAVPDWVCGKRGLGERTCPGAARMPTRRSRAASKDSPDPNHMRAPGTTPLSAWGRPSGGAVSRSCVCESPWTHVHMCPRGPALLLQERDEVATHWHPLHKKKSKVMECLLCARPFPKRSMQIDSPHSGIP